MNYKQIAFFMAVVSLMTLLVVVIISNNSNPTQQVVDSKSDSHHGAQQSIDAIVFNKLNGKPAPDFTLESYDGKKIILSSLKGKNVVLFFSEGLMCYPACWNQIAAFGKDNRFARGDLVVLTIVNDRRKDWKSAIEKMPELAQAIVLFDTNRLVSKAYGVLALPSSMHRGQLPGHTYVIVDRDGMISFVRDDEQMAIRNDLLIQEIEKLN